jgi:hypothetical protein
VNSGGKETERPRCFQIEMIPPSNSILYVNNDGISFERNDCAMNDYWYVAEVSVTGVSIIFI